MRHITLFLILGALLLAESGCAFLPHNKPSRNPAPQVTTSPASPTPHQPWSLLPHFVLGSLFPHHRPPPPRALALTHVGVIKTVAHDGSFVIIELDPGVMIPPGRDLLVIPSEGSPIHLRAAENQPPYFIADVENGHPSPGQMVQQ